MNLMINETKLEKMKWFNTEICPLKSFRANMNEAEFKRTHFIVISEENSYISNELIRKILSN